MSEFAILWHLDGAPAQRREVERMAGRMGLAHADATVVEVRGSFGACHAALWLDPDAPEVSQPLIDAETGCVIVACARIDNRAELAAAIGGANGRRDDTELLMAAWKRWGKAMVERLRGDFAFAIFDPRQQLVFAARDPLGAIPLVQHFAAGKLLAVATSVRPLLTCPSIPTDFDDQRIVDYLVLATEGIDETATHFSAIRRVPVGHSLTASANRMEINRYHNLRCELDPDDRYSDEHYVEELRELMQRSVADRMREGWRVGSMLSGGLDSNSVAATAGRIARARGARLVTFSGTSDHSDDAHEMAGIRIGQSNPDFDARSLVSSDMCGLGEELPGFVDDVDDPYDYSNAIAIPLYVAARRAGLRGVFDGGDADSLLSWDDYPSRLWRNGRWVTAARESFGISAFHLCTVRETAVNMWHDLRPAIVPEVLRGWRRRRRQSAPFVAQANRRIAATWHINPAASQRLDLSGRQQLRDRTFGTGEILTEDESRRLMLVHPVTTGLLERFHRTGRAAGIMPLHPFFDLRLVEFAAKLPYAQRLRDGWIKWVLRRAMDGIVAPELVWRRGKDHVGQKFQHEFLANRIPGLESDLEAARTLLAPYLDVARAFPILRREAEAVAAGKTLSSETQLARVQQLARWIVRAAKGSADRLLSQDWHRDSVRAD